MFGKFGKSIEQDDQCALRWSSFCALFFEGESFGNSETSIASACMISANGLNVFNSLTTVSSLSLETFSVCVNTSKEDTWIWYWTE